MARKLLIAAAAFVLAAGVAPPVSSTPGSVGQAYPVPAHLELGATAVSCDNTGSTVEFVGTLVVGGLAVKISFKNNVKGTHEKVTLAEAGLEVTPQGGTWTLPKQPVLGGVGGNPWLSVQFKDENGKALSKRILLGRCVQGLKLTHVSKDVFLSGFAKALVQSLECSNKGSKIELWSEAASGGLNATLYADNNKNKVVHEEQTEAAVTFTLFPRQVIAKQGSLGGPGGNPLIYLQFVGASGPIGNEISLGRCVKLG